MIAFSLFSYPPMILALCFCVAVGLRLDCFVASSFATYHCFQPLVSIPFNLYNLSPSSDKAHQESTKEDQQTCHNPLLTSQYLPALIT